MPSERTNRPSASVLMISMVLPPEPVTTSPGLIALPDGMFSVVGTMPITLILGLSSAIASMAPTTAAPPPMSDFICSMFREVERDLAAVECVALATQSQRRSTLSALALSTDHLLVGPVRAPGDRTH